MLALLPDARFLHDEAEEQDANPIGRNADQQMPQWKRHVKEASALNPDHDRRGLRGRTDDEAVSRKVPSGRNPIADLATGGPYCNAKRRDHEGFQRDIEGLDTQITQKGDSDGDESDAGSDCERRKRNDEGWRDIRKSSPREKILGKSDSTENDAQENYFHRIARWAGEKGKNISASRQQVRDHNQDTCILDEGIQDLQNRFKGCGHAT
jgi:hypothetical protein